MQFLRNENLKVWRMSSILNLVFIDIVGVDFYHTKHGEKLQQKLKKYEIFVKITHFGKNVI